MGAQSMMSGIVTTMRRIETEFKEKVAAATERFIEGMFGSQNSLGTELQTQLHEMNSIAESNDVLRAKICKVLGSTTGFQNPERLRRLQKVPVAQGAQQGEIQGYS